MSLSGDLSTLDLADLLQNLEVHQKNGLLSVEGACGPAQLYFADGQLALFAYDGRPSLMDVLEAAEIVTTQDLDAARKKRKRTKKSMGETLATLGLVHETRLAEVAMARLTDEACELIASGAGAFTFTNGPVPRGVFDPEERRLKLRLPAGPLLLEAARREDHWRLIRERVPSDGTHYVLVQAPKPPEETAAATFQRAVLARVDGTRSVSEVAAAFPHRRFETYQLLADLIEAQAVRVAAPADLVKLCQELARHDAERAWVVLGRGLRAHPRNLALLGARALLAEEIGQLEEAAEALKMAVHLHLENDERDCARAGIDHLKELDPADPSVWERSLELALDEGDTASAIEDGRQLAELYRGPGLLKKACAVLERLVELDGESWELVRDLARARVDAGDVARGVQDLERFGDAHLAVEEYALGRRVFEEVIALDPDRTSARETLELIKSGELARKRERRRRLHRRVVAVVATLGVVACIAYESAARRAFVGATETVSRQRWIEEGRYASAIELYDAVRDDYPLASVAWYDARRRIADLAEKRDDVRLFWRDGGESADAPAPVDAASGE